MSHFHILENHQILLAMFYHLGIEVLLKQKPFHRLHCMYSLHSPYKNMNYLESLHVILMEAFHSLILEMFKHYLYTMDTKRKLLLQEEIVPVH